MYTFVIHAKVRVDSIMLIDICRYQSKYLQHGLYSITNSIHTTLLKTLSWHTMPKPYLLQNWDNHKTRAPHKLGINAIGLRILGESAKKKFRIVLPSVYRNISPKSIAV